MVTKKDRKRLLERSAMQFLQNVTRQKHLHKGKRDMPSESEKQGNWKTRTTGKQRQQKILHVLLKNRQQLVLCLDTAWCYNTFGYKQNLFFVVLEQLQPRDTLRSTTCNCATSLRRITKRSCSQHENALNVRY